MSKRAVILNLMLGATSLLFLLQILRILSTPSALPPPSAPSAAATTSPQKAEPTQARPLLAAYEIVAAKNLFNPDRTEAAASPRPAADKPLLYGVVIDGASRLAYLEDPVTKQTSGYKIGDPVAGGTVEEIEADRVVIRRPQGRLGVNLRDSSKPRSVARVGTASPQGASTVPLPLGDLWTETVQQ